MTTSELTTGDSLSATELREEFDRAFTVAEAGRVTDLDDFLSIRVGARPFALRLTGLARLESLRKVVSLPGAHPWLLGLTSSLGKLVPLFSAELALGFEHTGGERWVALVEHRGLVGFAFHSLDTYLRIPKSEIYGTGVRESGGSSEQCTIRTNGELRPVLNVGQIVSLIRRETRSDT